MKFQTTNAWLIGLVCITGGLCAAGPSGAQDPSQPPQDVNPIDSQLRRIDSQLIQQRMQPQLQQAGRRLATASELVTDGRRAEGKFAASIRTAAEAVRDAKGDEAKNAAQKKLTELLGKYFDDDTVQREKELTQIQERLAKLRELLERRRAKKQEILELQTKVALNEAEGLGFYDNEPSAKGVGYIGTGFGRPTASPLNIMGPPAPGAPVPPPAPGMPKDATSTSTSGSSSGGSSSSSSSSVDPSSGTIEITTYPK